MAEIVANILTSSDGTITRLAVGINSSISTITTLASAPSSLQGGSFRIRIDDELMLVTTGQNGTSWNLTRAVESSVAASHSANAKIRHVLTAGAVLAIVGSSSGGITLVDSSDDLPEEGNFDGDIRLSLADYRLYVWKATAGVWGTLSGGGGGGGASGGTAQNLFVQETRPGDGDILLNSLWIPTDGDLPAPLADWEVYSGTGDGNGGNLFIQAEEPFPTVNSLWIPLNTDGTAKYLDQWRVYVDLGNSADIGNQNLYFQSSLPADPISGALLVLLNGSGEPRSFDQWKVFT